VVSSWRDEGVWENSAIVADIAFANLGFVAQRSGRVDFLLHDVRICVFDVFTKQPREAPFVLSVVQRNGKSCR
jgi:hypothetical protein